MSSGSSRDYRNVDRVARADSRQGREKRKYRGFNKDRLRIGEDSEDRQDYYELQKRRSIIGYIVVGFFFLLLIGFFLYLYFGF